jgi:hypothetical protein
MRKMMKHMKFKGGEIEEGAEVETIGMNITRIHHLKESREMVAGIHQTLN